MGVAGVHFTNLVQANLLIIVWERETFSVWTPVSTETIVTVRLSFIIVIPSAPSNVGVNVSAGFGSTLF